MDKVLLTIGEIVSLIFILWCITFIATVVHELGHALAYYFAEKNTNWSIEVGTGRILIKTD